VLRRLPIRVRLTLAFTLVMAIVLAATGAFLYDRMQSDLDATLNQGLRSRADDVAALVRQADTGLADSKGSRLSSPQTSFAQVLDSRGKVIDGSPAVRGRPLIDSAELARAQRGSTLIDHSRGPVRLLATPVRAQDQRLVVVVGASLQDRDHALARLRSLLLLGGPGALLLAALAGFGVTAAALRPIEAMRRRASAISASEPGGRLPVPQGSDEVARLGTTLNELLERLQDALERERRFVADASHELITPLAVLQIELELGSERPPEELPAVVSSAREETRVLTRLARDLLVLARSDGGKLPLERSAVELPALFERLAARFGIEASAPEGLVLEADPLRLEQALGNLIDNAQRYGAGRVELSARSLDGRVELHVTDEGAGFPAEFLPRAFARFSRADESIPEGAGLGLAIAETIAAAHGGGADAANRPDGGADVWISLPFRFSSDESTRSQLPRATV
jgi:signal transduction histidine kinase